MITFHAHPPAGEKPILFVVFDDQDIDGMRSAARQILSVLEPGPVKEVVVLYGSEGEVVPKLERAGLTLGPIQRRHAPLRAVDG